MLSRKIVYNNEDRVIEFLISVSFRQYRWYRSRYSVRSLRCCHMTPELVSTL